MNRNALRRVGLSFAKAFAVTFLAGLTGLSALPDWSSQKAALIAAVIGGLDAGAKAVQIALEAS